jgi:undecaprenyl pyrophosphate synthase
MISKNEIPITVVFSKDFIEKTVDNEIKKEPEKKRSRSSIIRDIVVDYYKADRG